MSEKESKESKRAEEVWKILERHETALGDILSTLQQLEQRTSPKEGKSEEGKGDVCPDCGVYVQDLYKHLKKEPDKHGLVKTVEVTKEVTVPPEKKSIKERLAEHDIFDCPDCRKDVDEHLAKKGLEITKKKEESEWSFEI